MRSTPICVWKVNDRYDEELHDIPHVSWIGWDTDKDDHVHDGRQSHREGANVHTLYGMREEETPHVGPDGIASDSTVDEVECEYKARESEGGDVREEESDKQDDVQEEDDGRDGHQSAELVGEVMDQDGTHSTAHVHREPPAQGNPDEHQVNNPRLARPTRA